MGDGLATSTQLAAFREQFRTFNTCPTIWMSATIAPQMLQTVDMPGAPDTFELMDDDFAREDLSHRLTAPKHLERAHADCTTAQGLARFLVERTDQAYKP
jgi:CRISPR-associated endonuclease/helicase Cas3